jgi:uncharacterized protein
MMTGQTNLQELLGTMQPLLHPDIYVFATVPSFFKLPLEIEPVMMFQESEGKTLILKQADATRLGIEAIFPCRMVTLQVHSSLEAVGFLAAITEKLASAGMGVNPVSAFFHDHLFLSIEHVDRAITLLKELAAENGK